MENIQIKLFSIDKCREVSKVYNIGRKVVCSDLLFFIPQNAFGKNYKVNGFRNNAFLVTIDSQDWEIPSFFVESVSEYNPYTFMDEFRKRFPENDYTDHYIAYHLCCEKLFFNHDEEYDCGSDCDGLCDMCWEREYRQPERPVEREPDDSL